MDENKTIRIIKKYLSGRFASETETNVQKWLIREKDQQLKEQASFDYWNNIAVEADKNTYESLSRVNKRIGYTGTQKYSQRKLLHKKVWRVAAIFIPFFLIAGAAVYFSWQKNDMTEIFVAYGDKKQLFLPDGSEIRINSGTTIQYPTAFNGDKRVVYLDGEASFLVVKDRERPFVVQTKRLSVRVLGTEFNVKAYADDEKIITTLASGKIEVNTQTNESKVLKPKEQLVFNKKTSEIDITEIPETEIEGWLSGQLIFTEVNFDEIIRTLERRYDIVLENRISNLHSKQYTIKFLKNESLPEILNILEDVVGFSYQQHKEKFILINK